MAKLSKTIDEVIENLINLNLEDVLSDRFSRYSKQIIQNRALPDVRDGLKPVQRRILYGMWEMGLLYNKPYKKSAKVVGDVMGKYHPHGDSSIYEAMVRMSQDFKMNHLLVDMHGNNGSIDGDSAAAMRYTEARLSEAASYLLNEIDKKTVPFILNFDDSESEPVVLPAGFPNLLVNGAFGISAGYATKIPSHNLSEIIDATIYLINKDNANIEEILNIVKGPDFPTGGIIQGQDGINQALETGIGKIIIRAKLDIVPFNNQIQRIIIQEIPYDVNKADLIKVIDSFRINKKIEDILEVRDETDQQGLSIVIDVKQNANINTIINYLYKNSDLQVSFNYNMVSIINGRPVLCGIIPILQAFIEHQTEVFTNKFNDELAKTEKRVHILEGLIKMISVLDEIILIIRNAKNKADAKEQIIATYSFSDIQTEAILMLQLYRLSNTDVIALQTEHTELSKRIKRLNYLLNNEKALLGEIKDNLNNIKEKLGVPRKSSIEKFVSTIKIDEEDLIICEDVYFGVTAAGYIKKASPKSYSQTNAPGLKQNDTIHFEGLIKTTDTALLFTNLGNFVFLPVFKLEEQKWKDIGIYINNIVPILKDEKIIKTIIISNFSNKQAILLGTKNGFVKQVDIKEFLVQRYSKPIKAMKISTGDELISVDIGPQNEIICISKLGYTLRFDASELPFYSLQAAGVRGIMLSNDFLVSLVYCNNNDDLLILTNRGHILNEAINEIPKYTRGRKGVLLVEKLKANPHLVTFICRLTKNQVVNNVNVFIASESKKQTLVVSDLKYQNNKFGKKVFEGEPMYFELIKDINDIYIVNNRSVDVKTKDINKVGKSNDNNDLIKQISIVEEEALEPQTKKAVRISKLDFFDD